MYIPPATNTLTDFQMATNSRLIVEKGSNCASIYISTRFRPKGSKGKMRNRPIMGCQGILSKGNHAVLPVCGYSIEKTTTLSLPPCPIGLTVHQNRPELVYKRVVGWKHVGVGRTPGCPRQQIKRPHAAYEERKLQPILSFCAPLRAC